jgi:hypothetical protein
MFSDTLWSHPSNRQYQEHAMQSSEKAQRETSRGKYKPAKLLTLKMQDLCSSVMLGSLWTQTWRPCVYVCMRGISCNYLHYLQGDSGNYLGLTLVCLIVNKCKNHDIYWLDMVKAPWSHMLLLLKPLATGVNSGDEAIIIQTCVCLHSSSCWLQCAAVAGRSAETEPAGWCRRELQQQSSYAICCSHWGVWGLWCPLALVLNITSHRTITSFWLEDRELKQVAKRGSVHEHRRSTHYPTPCLLMSSFSYGQACSPRSARLSQSQSQSQSHIATVGLSVSMSWCRAQIWDFWPEIFFLKLLSCNFFFFGQSSLIMKMKMFATLDKARPHTENVRGSNLAAVTCTTVQVSKTARLSPTYIWIWLPDTKQNARGSCTFHNISVACRPIFMGSCETWGSYTILLLLPPHTIFTTFHPCLILLPKTLYGVTFHITVTL